jgi:hypothetical protein
VQLQICNKCLQPKAKLLIKPGTEAPALNGSETGLEIWPSDSDILVLARKRVVHICISILRLTRNLKTTCFDDPQNSRHQLESPGWAAAKPYGKWQEKKQQPGNLHNLKNLQLTVNPLQSPSNMRPLIHPHPAQILHLFQDG